MCGIYLGCLRFMLSRKVTTSFPSLREKYIINLLAFLTESNVQWVPAARNLFTLSSDAGPVLKSQSMLLGSVRVMPLPWYEVLYVHPASNNWE